jgi:hypothetical protein
MELSIPIHWCHWCCQKLETQTIMSLSRDLSFDQAISSSVWDLDQFCSKVLDWTWVPPSRSCWTWNRWWLNGKQTSCHPMVTLSKYVIKHGWKGHPHRKIEEDVHFQPRTPLKLKGISRY